ncbi:DUF86 domain-containing protein [bacterium]|nr:DUF86 domain-containing protein [bacterium]
MKNNKLYLSNILECIEKIEAYTQDGRDNFRQNSMIQDAVIRNFEVIGEVTKRLSTELKQEYPDVEWKKIAGLRDILIHDYLRVDLEEVWLIVETDLFKLKEKVLEISTNLARDN